MGTRKKVEKTGWHSKIIKTGKAKSANQQVYEELKRRSEERRKRSIAMMNLNSSRYYSDWAARYASAIRIIKG